MVYGYVRSATGNEKQIEEQKVMIADYCKNNNLVWTVVVDGRGSGLVVGKKLQKLLGDLKEGDVVITKDISRISREYSSVRNIVQEMHNKDVRLIFVG